MRMNFINRLSIRNLYRILLISGILIIGINEGIHAQDSLILKAPSPGDATYYSQLKWNENDIFSTMDYVKWDYSHLRPTTIVEEKFSAFEGGINFSKEPTIQWNKGIGDIQYFTIENNEVVLVGESHKSDFTKSQIIHYDVLGIAVDYPLVVYPDMVITNQYDKVATLARDQITFFSNLPVNCDSLKVIISVEESSAFSNIRSMDLYHSDEQAIMKNTHDLSTLTFKIKFGNDNNWYPYVYNRVDLPRSLMSVASQAYTRTYKYYHPDYFMPVLSYRRTNRKIHEIQMQDKLNVFDVPQITVKGKSILATPNPTPGMISFKMINYPIGPYRLQVYDITGKRIKMYNFSPDASNEFIANFTDLKKGVYLYNFIDYLGHRSATYRLIKVGP